MHGFERWKGFLPWIVWIAVFYAVLSSGRAVLDDGDALYAHVAQQMVARGDWVTPYANGLRFLDKPPMLYWLTAFCYLPAGSGEFAARLPSILAVLGTSLILWRVARRAAGVAAGTAAALCFAYSAGTILFTLQAFPDIIFVFFLTLALAAFLDWYGAGCIRLRPSLLFFAACAGAVLTKGALGLFFPAAIVLLFLLWERRLSALRGFHAAKGFLLFALLAVPWHVAAALRNPGFLRHYLVEEHILRFLGRREPFDYHSISLPLFWMLALVWLFPWSAFLPAMVRTARASVGFGEARRSAIRLVICWIGIVGFFFSLSSRIEHYSLPLVPAAALLAGISMAGAGAVLRREGDGLGRSLRRSYAFLAFLGVLTGLPALAASVAPGTLGWTGADGAAVKAPRAYEFYFAPIFDLPPEVRTRLLIPVGILGLAVALLLPAGRLLFRRGRPLAAVCALAAAMTVFGFCVRQSIRLCEDLISSKAFAPAVAALGVHGGPLVVAGDYETANSLNFYTGGRLLVCGGDAAVLRHGMRYPDAPPVVLTRQEFLGIWEGEDRCLVLGSAERLRDLGLRQAFVVKRAAGRELVLNRRDPR